MVFSMIKKFFRNESGTTAIEFGLVGIMFIMLIAGIFETGRLFYTLNAFQYAVENTTRYALVQNEINEEELREYAYSQMMGLVSDQNDINVTISEETQGETNFVVVSGTYRFRTVTAILPDKFSSIPLDAVSRLPIPSSEPQS